MIYCTAHDKESDIAELYKEWTKRPPDWRRMLCNSYSVVARDSTTGMIVGATQYILIADPFWGRKFALVENVYVAPEYRRQGVGKLLMEFTETQARALGCEFMKLTTRKDAGKLLYRSLGYEEGSSFYKRF